MKIALIDSGLTPHPYLPATSFSETCMHIDGWPENMKNNIRARTWFDDLIKFETQPNNVLSPKTNISEQNNFVSSADKLLYEFQLELWDNWKKEVDNWYYLSEPIQKRPPVPVYKNPLGVIRRISSESRNFVDDSLNIDDTSGHGTQMAGILAARSPITLSIIDQVKDPNVLANVLPIIQKYEVDVIGIVPSSELMILKCYDKDKIDDSTLAALLKALEYAHLNKADIVYVGLIFSSQKLGGKQAKSIIKIAQFLYNKGIPIVCPVGNNGNCGFDWPAAAVPDVIAITSVIMTGVAKTSVMADLSSKSNFADVIQGEEVAFAAFGGDDEQKVITTSTEFGFCRVSGTSVAAAISTGILAFELSSRYKKQVDDKYIDILTDCRKNLIVPSSLPVPLSLNPDPQNRIPHRIPLDDLNDLIETMRNNANIQVLSNIGSVPDQRFGWGLINCT